MGWLRKVYICGAHSVGKTTLCKYLCDHLVMEDMELYLSSEIARQVIKENPDIEVSQYNEKSFLQLNLLIIEHQHKRSQQLKAASDNSTKPLFCICDRSPIDPVTYLQMFIDDVTADATLRQKNLVEMTENMRDRDKVIVVVIKPYIKFLECDHVRIDTTFDELLVYDEIMRNILTKSNVEFFYMEKETDLRERAEFVLGAIKSRWPSVTSYLK